MVGHLRTRLCPVCYRITWHQTGPCSLCLKGARTRA